MTRPLQGRNRWFESARAHFCGEQLASHRTVREGGSNQRAAPLRPRFESARAHSAVSILASSRDVLRERFEQHGVSGCSNTLLRGELRLVSRVLPRLSLTESRFRRCERPMTSGDRSVLSSRAHLRDRLEANDLASMNPRITSVVTSRRPLIDARSARGPRALRTRDRRVPL